VYFKVLALKTDLKWYLIKGEIEFDELFVENSKKVSFLYLFIEKFVKWHYLPFMHYEISRDFLVALQIPFYAKGHKIRSSRCN